MKTEAEEFAETLRDLRKRRGYSQQVAADIVGTTRRSFVWWEMGRAPDAAKRSGVLRILRESQQPPSPAKLKAMADTHHIYWEAERGWTVRYTLELHKKQVGTRRKTRLRTHDLDEALKRRDLVISVFTNLGFTIAKKRQKRRSPAKKQPNAKILP